MTRSFTDHFSTVAPAYARFRPRYPQALFDWLADVAPSRNCAWDCATGSGQAAVPLTRHFRAVIVSDASREQLRSADGRSLHRVASLAEAAPIRTSSVDLVTVAQALHWLTLTPFFAEARRCLVPGGLIAAWTYSLCLIEAGIDAIIGEFYHDTLAGCWPVERGLVERGYATLDFPFAPVPAPQFAMSAEWTLDALVGYLSTWSAVGQFRTETGTDPIPGIRERLERLWGGPDRTRLVHWPLSLRVGQVGPPHSLA